jgi:hypothetical protein
MSKQRRIKREQNRRAKLQACGHGSRHRNKRGCVVCRRENGATLGKPFKPRKSRQTSDRQVVTSMMAQALREVAS